VEPLTHPQSKGLRFSRASYQLSPVQSFLALSTPWGGRKVKVEKFYPAAGQGGSIELATTSLRKESMLPPTVLVIAALDNHGSALCISLESDTYGHVYFWDAMRAITELASTESLADFASFMAPVASSLNELSGLLVDEQTADAAMDALPVPSSPPPAPVLRESDSPTWMVPTPLADMPPHARLFTYTPQRQPNLLATKPLADARDNSGVPFVDVWQQPHLGWMKPDDGSIDLINANGLLIIRGRVQEVMAPILEPYGELLPFSTDTGPMLAFRCLTILDALEADVQVRASTGSADVCFVEDFRFVGDVVDSAGIFTVPQQPVKPITFFTREIVDAISTSGASHLDFTPVWQAD